MNTLQIPLRYGRLHSWHLLILLPVLPFLTSSLELNGSARYGSAGLALVMGGLGGLAAFGLPALVRLAGWTLRKEVEQLRPAWIVALFAVQVPLLFTDDLMFFVTTCAFLAAIPFGAEYQQRTMAGLLSQPVPRDTVWQSKMAVLGVGLLAHWACFLVARLIAGHNVDASVAGGLLVAAFAAWGTTTWWSLLCRGLLAGLVFSLTVPLLVLTALSAGGDLFLSWDRFDDPLRATRLYEALQIYVGLPIYALLGSRASRRVWSHLEAPDGAGNPTGMAIAGGILAPRASRTSPWRNLVIKEFRLQTVAWLALGMSVLLVAHAACAERFQWNLWTREYAWAAAMLGAFATFLLLGAIPIAEERCLGTLDNTILHPIPRFGQWLLKLSLPLITSWILVAGIILTPTRPIAPEDVLTTFAVVTAVVGVAFLASSGAMNGMRALLSAVLIIGTATTALILSRSMAESWAHAARRVVEEQAANDPATWMALAKSLGRSAAEAPPPLSFLPPLEALLTLAAGVGVLACLWLSWRNFCAPAQAVSRFRRQTAYLLTGFVAALSITSAVHVKQVELAQRQGQLLEALNHVEWFDTLPPAEQRLWRSTAGDGFQVSYEQPFQVWMSVRKRSDGQLKDIVGFKSFRFPLSRADKEELVRKADLTESNREALRLEAGLPAGPIPQFTLRTTVSGQVSFQMDPRLMRRYGLLPVPAPTPEPPPVPPDTTRSEPAPAP
ncbi:MAG: hypothetical protein IT580_06050 [Verrucomicrobiales bacterium]|nr:hypothetical protein [Verrucomicrobiales bacterium]